MASWRWRTCVKHVCQIEKNECSGGRGKVVLCDVSVDLLLCEVGGEIDSSASVDSVLTLLCE